MHRVCMVLKGTLMPWNSGNAVLIGALILFMLVAALSSVERHDGRSARLW
jgi:hypothetical protein